MAQNNDTKTTTESKFQSIEAAQAEKDYQAKYRAEHREQRLAYHREYNALHHEQKLSSNRKWREAHREQKNTSQREYDELQREQRKAYYKAWRDSHREQIRAWRDSHREQIRASRAKWRAANPEAQVAWYAAHREEIAAQYASSPELQQALKTYQSNRREANRMQWLATKAKYRAKKRGLEFDGLRTIIEAPLPTNCACCAHGFDYSGADLSKVPSLDRVDTSKGYTCDNTRVICYRCNTIKSNATLDELRMIVAYMER